LNLEPQRCGNLQSRAGRLRVGVLLYLLGGKNAASANLLFFQNAKLQHGCRAKSFFMFRFEGYKK